MADLERVEVHSGNSVHPVRAEWSERWERDNPPSHNPAPVPTDAEMESILEQLGLLRRPNTYPLLEPIKHIHLPFPGRQAV